MKSSTKTNAVWKRLYSTVLMILEEVTISVLLLRLRLAQYGVSDGKIKAAVASSPYVSEVVRRNVDWTWVD